MRFASLGSGSSGNATIIQSEQTTVMLDCGFSCKETLIRLEKLGINASDIDAMVVTHEHNDHISGIGVFARKFDIPVWCNYGTWQSNKIGKIKQLQLFNSSEVFQIGSLVLQPFIVPHDSRESVQFIFQNHKKRLAILTDLGHITPHIKNQLIALDALIIETNHDLDLLQNGNYRHSLKKRVSGNYGHLNNHQAANLVKSIDYLSFQHIVAAHLSNENNSLTHTEDTFRNILGGIPKSFKIADKSGYSWMHIN